MATRIYSTTQETYDQLGEAYVRATWKLIPAERATFARLAPKGARILDVGCAGGRDAHFFAGRRFRVTGVDVSRVLLRIARIKTPRATFKYMDARSLRFPAGSFDAIWANAVLLHVYRKDVPAVLRGFHRILKPGGIVHVRVKVGKGMSWAKDKLAGNHQRLFVYYTREEMAAMLRQAGFTVFTMRNTGDESKRNNVRWVYCWARRQG